MTAIQLYYRGYRCFLLSSLCKQIGGIFVYTLIVLRFLKHQKAQNAEKEQASRLWSNPKPWALNRRIFDYYGFPNPTKPSQSRALKKPQERVENPLILCSPSEVAKNLRQLKSQAWEV